MYLCKLYSFEIVLYLYKIGGDWEKSTWDLPVYFCNFLFMYNYFKIKSLKS